MAGFVPAIDALKSGKESEDVDGSDKRGQGALVFYFR
jgi:hypothetical protein